MSISLEKLETLFAKLAAFGKNNEGGLTRLSYSPEFQAAQTMLAEFMKNIGMTVAIDAVGNMIGTYPGRDNSLAPVCCGSHLDSVPNGGTFDGALGIVTALECLRSWHEENWQPLRPVKVIAFVEEEGSRFGSVCFGSRAMAGELQGTDPVSFRNSAGRTLPEFLADCHLDNDPFNMETSLQNNAAFVELHIEQGAALTESGCSVGIVTAIAGIKRLNVVIKGKANHSGSTAMHRRQDALVAASALVAFVYDNALASQGNYVATVGKLNVLPNAENVIPGEVQLTIEMRSAATDVLETAKEKIIRQYLQISTDYKVTIETASEYNVAPMPMDKELIKTITEASDDLGIEYQLLPSWAGHDAMIIGRYIPTAMIFVPSINGISHSPLELSEWPAIEKATKVLDSTLKTLASK
ncbi:MAG: Zn-dependent hydrolase [Acidaminococcaceae bacterium]